MTKRLIISALLLIIPVIGLAYLRIRTSESAAASQTPAAPAALSGPSLPEAIADLQRRIDGGAVKPEFEERTGYLKSLLKELDIPVSSQTLVFGKNSAQLFLISPEAPRALYFNDNVYLGYVQGAPYLELASMDPEAG